jgi:hypothetical protein
MAHPVTLSKTKLLAYAQCPRKLWLAQYRPEIEDEAALDHAAIAAGHLVRAKAREVYGPGHVIAPERGLRAAIAATSELIAAGGTTPVFEATFDHEGLTVQVDILDRSRGTPRIVAVKSSAAVKAQHLTDCAIQAWTLAALGVHVSEVAVAHVDGKFVYAGDGDYAKLLVEQNVTAQVDALRAAVPALVASARTTLEALDEPQASIGAHCTTPYPCPFFGHCAAPQPSEPGGGAQRLVPAPSLPRPRYYLAFATIARAIPIWPWTHPHEALPFLWSVHIDDGGADESAGGLGHAAFLSLSGEPPMRACAEALIETLGNRGPIVVAAAHERRIIEALGARYADLSAKLDEICARVVVLEDAPSARAVGNAHRERTTRAQISAAYLEASDAKTAPPRREKLRNELLAYGREATRTLASRC